jgi:hypothetical protein
MRPLENMNTEFEAYRNAVDTSVYSQVCYMRGMLNDYFDYYHRRIIVRNTATDGNSHLIWQEQYDKPYMIYNEDYPDTYKPVLLNRDGQTGANDAGFEVVLPAGYILSDDERNRMTALVNSHKLASKKFIITYGQH